MIVKPNELVVQDDGEDVIENDLYRKFNAVFSEILHPEDNSYDTDMYLKTKNDLEGFIIRKMKNNADEIVPILGYIGMGKTYLMHYCIRKGFNFSGDLKNRSFIVSDHQTDSLCIYASYDACVADDKNEIGRLASKIATASQLVIEKMGIPNNTKEDKEEISREVAEFIKKNKPELLQLYAESPDDTDIEKAKLLFRHNKSAYEAEKLKWVLTCHDTNIKSIILILDDLEGLMHQTEYEVIAAYLAMYDCLRNIEKGNVAIQYKVKLFICMRERTYVEIHKVSTYDTHRISEPKSMSSGIKLHEIFMRRFNSIVEKRHILEDVEKKDTWNDAKVILEDLSQKLDWILSIVLLQICNYNICDAIQLYANVLSNRTWTQKNERAQECFKVEKYRFYLTNASCFKVMAMRNATVYRGAYEIPNLFYDNDRLGYCLPIYILLMLKGGRNELTLEDIQDNFNRVLNLSGTAKDNKEKQIQEVIEYYVKVDIIFEKISKQDEKKIYYYIAPKGRILLQSLFQSTILLEIFRDDLFLDDTNHNIRCSNDMNREDISRDIMQIIRDIAQEEIMYWNSSKANHTQELYYKVWRNDRITTKLISAMRRSLSNVFKGDIPDGLNKEMADMEEQYGSMFST